MAAKLVLSEDEHDYHFLLQLLLAHQITDWTFVGATGIDNLFEKLKTDLKTQLDHAIIVLDADTNFAARRRSVTDRLESLGYRESDDVRNPDEGFLFSREDTPVVGVWIMPDNQSTGALEEFAASLISDSVTLWTTAGQTVEKLPMQEGRFPDKYAMKAKVHTYLAWQEEPGKPLGLGLKAKYFDAQSSQARS